VEECRRFRRSSLARSKFFSNSVSWGVFMFLAQTVAAVERSVFTGSGLRRFAATASGGCVFVFSCDHQATECVQIATQQSQLQITFKTNL
jgi:hypothetical protein